jgi:SnoaL-like domain
MRRRFDQESALAAVELAQMVADYCHALDRNEGADAVIFFTEDCIVEAGAISYRGHAAMKKFYAEVAQHAQTQQNETVWTSRHGFINFRISALEETRATVNFIFVHFSGSGKPPLAGTTPSIVSDARFDCRRAPGGTWLIAEFHATPIFMGDDPLVRNFVAGR